MGFIIVLVFIGAIVITIISYTSKRSLKQNIMTKAELIEKLTTSHFEKGNSFDKEVFASLVELLKENEIRKKIFIKYLKITIGYTVLMVIFIAALNDIVDDHPILLILLLPALIFLFKSLKPRFKEQMSVFKITKAYKTLDITEEEVKAAIQKVKQENTKN